MKIFFKPFYLPWIKCNPTFRKFHPMETFIGPFLEGLRTDSSGLHISALSGLVLLGLFLLTKGGDFLTDGASELARGLGVSPAIIGLTVVSISTSAPELFTSLAAISGEAKNLIIGNVVGSNLANVGLVLGIAALVRPLKAKGALPNWQTNVLLLVTMLFSICCLSLGRESFGREAGMLFVSILIVYLFFVTKGVAKGSSNEASTDEDGADASSGKAILLVLGATVALWFGSEVLVIGAKGIATSFEVPQELIGLTVLAIGTSLPELAATWALAKRGESGMLLGNVVGSNLFNLTFVAGLAGTVSPIPVKATLGQVEFPAMLFLTALLCWLSRRETITFRHGIILLAIYFATISVSWVLHG